MASLTSTDHFQKLPTFYDSPEECHKNNKPSTNPRYSNFTQFCFTAGDVDQFETYRNPTNGTRGEYNVNIENNEWNTITPPIGENVDWMRYHNINTETIDNTFRYLFEKFKKGLFIKIKDNQLSVFLPFSKHDYVNEWSHMIRHPPSFPNMTSFLINSSRLQGYEVTESNINRFPSTWYGNNCLIRSEFPIAENDRGLPNIKDMFTTLCKERQVPDIELFINKRDFPVLKKSYHEPYEHIFGSETYPLISHRYETYCPILSMVTTNNNADIPIPTAEDWARVGSRELGHYFPPDCRDYRYDFSMKWEDRIPTAVFRGASTGCGVTIETNPRLKVSYLSTISPTEDGFKLLDAGITKWNMRPRKHISSPYLQIIDRDKIGFSLVQPLIPTEQSRYKYIVHVDGHVSSFRLSLEMDMGSVLLIAESKYRLWFRRYLKEYEHYVPVKEDLSDLFEKIRWCRQNDQKCKEIAENARRFYQQYLKKDGILDYLQTLLVNIKSTTGSYYYNHIPVQTIIKEWQLSRLSRFENEKVIKEIKVENYHLDFFDSSYPCQEGFRLTIKNNKNLFNKDNEKENDLHKNKDTHVYLQKINNITVVCKRTDRKHEWINEAYCGLNAINHLRKEIPNFRYTYDVNLEKEMIICEYVKGVTFKQYIDSGNCSLENLTLILSILSMALAVAQEKYGFVHYDLYPWNIIITTYEKPKTVTYSFGKYNFVVNSSIIPVIIDYGRSHIIDTKIDIHTGTIEPFKTNVFQDCFSLIVTSVQEMVKIRNNSDHKYLIYLVNFFSETEFQREKLENNEHLKSFLAKHKKYNEMIYGNKCGLERKNPVELFYYLSVGSYGRSLQPYIKQYKKNAPFPIYQNPEFYYDLYTKNDISLRLKTYLLSLKQFDKSAKDELSVSYTCNLMTSYLEGVKEFCKTVNVELPLKEIEEIEKIIKDWYSSHFNYEKLQISVQYPKNDMLCVAKYDIKTFSMPAKILTMLQGNGNTRDDRILSVREMFHFCTTYQVPYPLSVSFIEKFISLMDINPIVITNHNANINTIKMISKYIYHYDQIDLKKMQFPPSATLSFIENINRMIS